MCDFFVGNSPGFFQITKESLSQKRDKTGCPAYREGILFSMHNLFFEAISEDWMIYNKYKHRFLNAAPCHLKTRGGPLNDFT